MKKRLLLMLFAFANIFTLFAQVPSNDECAGAITLTPSTSCSTISGTLLNATTSTTTSSCGYYRDVFYKFVANAPTATVTVVGSTGLDPVVGTFAACGGTSINCVDGSNTGGTEYVYMTGLTVGATYFIKVQHFYSGVPTTSTFAICVVSTPVTPANDECSGAIALTPSTTCSPITGTIANATTSTITPSCSGNRDVFYKFVANAPTATVSVTGSSGLDVEIATFSACGGASLACQDATVSGQTETINMAGLIVGNTYIVKVQDWASTQYATTYTFTICVVSIPVVPSNDECAGAIALTPSTTCSPITGTIANATTSTITSSCGFYRDVFYKFVANAPTAVVTVVGSAGLDPVVATFAACGGASINCQDNSNTAGTETVNMTGLTVGSTYFIKVQNYYSNVPTTSTFTICVVSTPVVTTPPANNECAGAITLTPSPTCAPISGTVLNATSTVNSTGCTPYYDVFYKFVATATTATVTAAGSAGLDLQIAAFTSCVAGNLACIDNNWNYGGTETMALTGLTVGSTYYVSVGSYTTSMPTTYTFTVCVVDNTTTTSTQSSTALSSISMYPNPAQNVLNIENISSTTSVELIDMSGKTVYSENIDGDTQLNVSNYSAGVYILKLSVEGFAENRRVVISK